MSPNRGFECMLPKEEPKSDIIDNEINFTLLGYEFRLAFQVKSREKDGNVSFF